MSRNFVEITKEKVRKMIGGKVRKMIGGKVRKIGGMILIEKE